MILEFFSGFFISVLAIFFFIRLNYMESVNKWILVLSKFVYYSGHPILNEDQIFDEISKRFKQVFTSLVTVILKTVSFILAIILLVGFSSLLISMIRSLKIPELYSSKFISFVFPNYLVHLPFLIGSIIPVLFIPYFLNKRRVVKKDVYSPIDKFLHYTFLGNKNIAKFLFNLELFFNKRKIKNVKEANLKNVYISGLARAGTTVLMQYLGQLPEFKSLSYKNLPFLFMPKTGLKVVSKKEKQEIERFHQDGIKHSIESYEALEEPFWRNYIGQEYIFDKTIQKHEVDKKVYEKYVAFRKLVASDKIYLAKNNNHLLRAESLAELDRSNGIETITIIPFRDPYEQAKSLLKQHVLLSDLQKEDEFTLDYMDFLVHHEFGLHTKAPLLNSEVIIINNHTKDKLDYWLEIWYSYYNEMYKQFSEKEGFCFFCYETFVNDPQNSIKSLLKVIGLSEKKSNTILFNVYKSKTADNDMSKNEKYSLLYKKIKFKAINNF